MSTINAKNEYAAERPAKFFAIFQALFELKGRTPILTVCRRAMTNGKVLKIWDQNSIIIQLLIISRIVSKKSEI